MSNLTAEKYNERAFVVRGNTRKYKEELKKLGGRWNPNLKNGPGWIFSIRQHTIGVNKFLKNVNNLSPKKVEKQTYVEEKVVEKEEEEVEKEEEVVEEVVEPPPLHSESTCAVLFWTTFLPLLLILAINHSL